MIFTVFAVVHDSPSIRAGPSLALFRKLGDGELSDKILPWRAAIQRVTCQLLSKVYIRILLCNSMELKLYTWPSRGS